jgi:hypothetical protein
MAVPDFDVKRGIIAFRDEEMKTEHNGLWILSLKLLE